VAEAGKTRGDDAAVPARVADARELRKAVFDLPWGPKPERDAQREVRALRRAMDALTKAEVAQRRAGVGATSKHHDAWRRALDRLIRAYGELGAVVGDRIAWVFRVLHTVTQAERATDPVGCAVVDEHVRQERRTLTDLRLVERGRAEMLEWVSREPGRKGGQHGKGKPKQPHTALFWRAGDFLEQNGQVVTPATVRKLLPRWQQLAEIGDPLPDIVDVNVRGSVIDIEYSQAWAARRPHRTRFIEINDDALGKALARRPAR